MNRRQFNATAAAALFLPSIRVPRQRVRHIDLSLFCTDEGWDSRYNLKDPFQQEGLNYATDARVCVRTALPVQMHEAGETVRLPKACGLPWWTHDQQTGWQSWDKFHLVPAGMKCGHDCPKCFGKGRVGYFVQQCPKCDGEGDWLAEFGEALHPCECRSGYIGGAKCGHCDGKGSVDFELRLDGCHVAPAYHAKIATLGEIEYCVIPDGRPGEQDVPLVLFRGQDVDGILCGLKVKP